MPMREECKNFESRTYANGETVRKCDLDLAPEAPWRCPDDCPRYERRAGRRRLEPRHARRRPPDARPSPSGDGIAAAARRGRGHRQRGRRRRSWPRSQPSRLVRRRRRPGQGLVPPQALTQPPPTGSDHDHHLHPRRTRPPLGGPDWLRDRRVAAATEAADAARCPPPSEEVWRYSRIDELDLDALRPGRRRGRSARPDGGTRGAGRSCAPAHWSCTTVTSSTPSSTPSCRGSRSAWPTSTRRRALGSVPPSPTTCSRLLNDAFCADPIVVRVPPGVTVDRPDRRVATGSTPTASPPFPRLVVEAGEDSEVTVVEQLRVAASRCRRSSCPSPSSTSRAAARLALPRRAGARHRDVADRPPGRHRSARTRTFLVGHRRARRRLRPAAHRLPPRRPRRHRRPARRSTSATATRCTTSARSRTTTRPTPPATCCSRARSRPRRVASTPASSGSARTPAAPTRSRPTATSSSPTTRGPSRCRTSRSRTTTCAAATPPPSGRSTRSSASTSRAAACRRRSPSG